MRQCALVGLAHSTWYYRAAGESAENLALMRAIDEQYLRTPFYGSRKLAVLLSRMPKNVPPANLAVRIKVAAQQSQDWVSRFRQFRGLEPLRDYDRVHVSEQP